MKEVSG